MVRPYRAVPQRDICTARCGFTSCAVARSQRGRAHRAAHKGFRVRCRMARCRMAPCAWNSRKGSPRAKLGSCRGPAAPQPAAPSPHSEPAPGSLSRSSATRSARSGSSSRACAGSDIGSRASDTDHRHDHRRQHGHAAARGVATVIRAPRPWCGPQVRPRRARGAGSTAVSPRVRARRRVALDHSRRSGRSHARGTRDRCTWTRGRGVPTAPSQRDEPAGRRTGTRGNARGPTQPRCAQRSRESSRGPGARATRRRISRRCGRCRRGLSVAW